MQRTIDIINETLRLYPPFWMIDREANNDDHYNGISIPKGTLIVPYIYGVHRNTSYFEQPEKFDPNRFKTKRHPFAHIPFGGGPRVCIGSNMAMMQMLLVVTSIVKRYDFRLAKKKRIQIRPMMILRPDGPIYLYFDPV